MVLAEEWKVTPAKDNKGADALRAAHTFLKDETFFEFHSKYEEASVEINDEAQNEWPPTHFLDRILFEEVADLLDPEDRDHYNEMYPDTFVFAGNGASTLLAYDLRKEDQPIIVFLRDNEEYFDDTDVVASTLAELIQTIGGLE